MYEGGSESTRERIDSSRPVTDFRTVAPRLRLARLSRRSTRETDIREALVEGKMSQVRLLRRLILQHPAS